MIDHEILQEHKGEKIIYAHVFAPEDKKCNVTRKSDEEPKDYLSYLDRPKSSILDSGNRREFDTGAVRDIQEGKGRCDLLPIDILNDYLQKFNSYSYDGVLSYIHLFVTRGDESYLYKALSEYVNSRWTQPYTMFLEVSMHFEEGAKKYGEYNWQKGIPVRCYIDSALRHYFKYCRGDTDEPHDRAFCWNLLCAIWTCNHMPELNDYRSETKIPYQGD